MSTAIVNLNALLKHAIASARDNTSMSVEQIIASVLADDKVCVDLHTISTGVDKPTKKPAEKKDRTRVAPAGPPKARAIPEDDARCYARSFYENQHIEADGHLKVMRDDPDNLYGDRCKFKKTGESDFCKHHAEKQVLGVWNGEYLGKFKTAVDKTENNEAPVAPKEPKKVVEAPKEDPKAEPKKPKEEPKKPKEEPKKPKEEPKKAAEKPKPKPKVEELVSESEDSDAEDEPEVTEPEVTDAVVIDIVIDKVAYLIDTTDGTVYDPDTEEVVGKYSTKFNRWIKKPVA